MRRALFVVCARFVTSVVFLSTGYSGAECQSALRPETHIQGAASSSLLRNSGFIRETMLSGRTVGSATVTMIRNVTELQGMQKNLSGNYQLANDIYAINYPFKPIGSESAPFVGSLNGNGFSILNLSISAPPVCGSGLLCAGLFGWLDGTVTNIRLANVNIAINVPEGSNAWVGGIAAASQGSVTLSSVQGTIQGSGNANGLELGGLVGVSGMGTISLSDADVSVVGSTSNPNGGVAAGGLVGSNTLGSIGSTITESRSFGPVTVAGQGTQFAVGGLVGENGGTIFQSYATGPVSNSAQSNGIDSTGVGGLVGIGFDVVQQSFATGAVQGGPSSSVGGLIGWSAGVVSQSYAEGAVTAGTNSLAGGLIGKMYCGCGPQTVVQTYSTGAVSAGQGSLIGGLVGAGFPSSDITNSYWDKQASGIGNPSQACGNVVCPGAKGLTTSQMQDGTLKSEVGFDPAVWEPMKTGAVQPAPGAYYPQLWALSFPITSFPLVNLTPYTAKIITVFDHSPQTAPNSGIAALYSAPWPPGAACWKNRSCCDDVVLAFTGQFGLSMYGQSGPTCTERGYAQNQNETNITLTGATYVGDVGAGGPTYLNYEGHPGIDYVAHYNYTTKLGTPVLAAVSGIVYYPWRAIGTGTGATNYDTYCRFHTLGEIPDSAASYRIYYLHLSTHPNGLGLASFPPDPSCTGSDNTPGQREALTAVAGCYTQAGQPFMPTTLPLPPGTHANAGCEIALSGHAGVPGAHLHFEIQQIVPAGASVNANAI